MAAPSMARALPRLASTCSAASARSKSIAACGPTRSSAVRYTSRQTRAFHASKLRFEESSSSSSTTTAAKSSSSKYYLGLGAVVVIGLGVAAYEVFKSNKKPGEEIGSFYASKLDKAKGGKIFAPAAEDYQKVYNAIAKRLEDNDDYDDGSYGPVLLRLAWHASGTYDAETKTGGSNGATMRFDPEADHGANAGLKAARDFLMPVKEQFPWISYSDLWTLAGVTAIQEMQGPTIPWRPGREDRTMAFCTPDGRLPDGSKRQDHLRAIFGRMGFDDREIVALSGAHAFGRCHTDRSGFEGPWTFSPTVFTNDYFKLLTDEKWGWRSWNGPKQYEDKKSKSLMMLPSDMCLIEDPVFKTHVKRYAKDEKVFFDEFSAVVAKLFELGVPFDEVVKKDGGNPLAKQPMVFKASA